MKFRLCYTTPDIARDKQQPKVGTIITLDTILDVKELQSTMEDELIFHFDKLPPFLQWGFNLWGEDCLSHMFDKEDIELMHLAEMPNKDWLNSPWVEVYNNYRE